MGENPLLFRSESWSEVPEAHLALIHARDVTDHFVASANKNWSHVAEANFVLVSVRDVADHLVASTDSALSGFCHWLSSC
jgi:hypothetical protein